MKLYGSGTSPFVRRIRLWLADEPYEFQTLDVFSDAGQDLLKSLNPTRKIPMLVDGEQVVFDSRVIHRYLNNKLQREEPLDWNQENRLTLVDAANDSLVELLLLERSGLHSDANVLFTRLQKQRIHSSLQALDIDVAKSEFKHWDFVSICLYCLLDWMVFRELIPINEYPNLATFAEQSATRPWVPETDPRI